MIGKTISHYKIIEKLGEGGMGVVYKAHDTKLDRLVALKFLPARPDIDKTDMKRFSQEAKAAAALNHQNICTIYEICDEFEKPFIVMEYVEGRTPRETIEATVGKPVSDKGATQAGKQGLLFKCIFDLAIQIAEALEEAHSKGILHRDIKSENIMVDSKHRVKVMDFGLAKLKGSSPITRDRSTVGTIAYMAPEQIQGDEVDSRADIYSFGVVLYEMCTGKLPFRGEHEAAIIYAIMNEEPEPISSYITTIPCQYENLIKKALKKNPSERYQSLQELLVDLRQLRPASLPEADSSTTMAVMEVSGVENSQGDVKMKRIRIGSRGIYIAGVLALLVTLITLYRHLFIPHYSGSASLNSDRIFVAAFENRTGDASLDPIGRLVSDWTIQGILQNEFAEVIPTTTMLQLIEDAGQVGGGLDERIKLVNLARETHSGILVSGMFYIIGENLQFHAQIIDTESNEVIFTLEPIRSPRNEPMKAINNLQKKIMGALAMHVYPGSNLRMLSDPPIYEAYVEFMEGTKYFGVDYEKSFEHYRRAIAIDSEFMHPRLRMAVGYGNLGQYAKADSILHSIDPQKHRLNSYERHYLDWYTFLLKGKLEESFAILLHLESIAPMDIPTNYIVGLFALYLNRPQKTVETYEKIEIPAHWADLTVLSWRFGVLCNAYHLLENYDKELEIARAAQRYYPTDLTHRVNEVRALAALERPSEVQSVIEECKVIIPSSGSVGLVILTASRELRTHGNKREALIRAEQAVEWYRENDTGNRSGLAEALYLAEKWDDSYMIRKEQVYRNPENITYQGALGALEARKGNTEEARRIADILKNTERKYLFGLNTYLCARIYALLGDRNEAVRLIRESFLQGRHFDIYIHHDMDLEPLHDFQPFQELIRPKG